jgi:uncharacterized NAD(P)/FAD-binding protein YdhS
VVRRGGQLLRTRPAATAGDPLVRRLLDGGRARVGPHALGLDIDGAGRLRAADGVPDDRVSVIGPLRRGARWETTAVPEIRAQAHRLAGTLSGAQERQLAVR